MKRFFGLLLVGLFSTSFAWAQDNPAIINWLINTTDITGRHYVSGNSTPISDTAQANVQRVRYSNDYAYVNSSGIPAYIIGPYLDGNPSTATHNHWLFKIPLNPKKNSGTLTTTPMGPIGVFINGVPIYDYRDGASYNSSTRQDDRRNGDGVWNRNAILAENEGFDCAKGHPSPIFQGGPQGTLAGGSYHHHQNPTAFNLDKVKASNICDLYLADGLYTLDDTKHAPLVGFAFDGFPIYGAYGYSDPNDPNSSIKLIKSSYQKRNITKRTQYADGTNVTAGPDVSTNFPLGWYKEDFEFIANSGDLDEYNGRFCKTPEYPNGTYAYFATVDDNWNSTFPYIVGPEYYGVVEQSNFTQMGNGNSVQIQESVETYTPSASEITTTKGLSNEVAVFPNPVADLLAVQIKGITTSDLTIRLINMTGMVVKSTQLLQGSTIWYLDTRDIYDGHYVVQIEGAGTLIQKKVIIQRD